MASPTFKLEEQLADQRSDQIAYKLTIANPGTTPIRLHSVEPRVPMGASLLQIRDTSLAEANALRAELVQELNRLLRQFLWVTSEAFRHTWVERQKEGLRELFTVIGILTFYMQLIIAPRGWLARMRVEFNSLAFRIASASDARSAYARWMQNANEHDTVRSLFEAKIEQLEHMEAQMDEDDRPGLTSIDSGSFFTATYVLKFARGLLEPRKYQVGFAVTYQEQDSGPLQTTSVATNVQISPYPFSLSIVAIVAALLGVLVRVSLAGAQDPIHEMVTLARSGHLLVGPVVALIFFNVYEYTSLGKGIGMSVSWRSALLIGAVCGLAQDRILAALKALVGV